MCKMANAVLIDLSNYSTLLKESTQSRTGSANGNIYFDTANGRVELITREELANVDLGTGSEPNPLTNQTGIFIGALYAFERLARKTNEELRKYDFFSRGTFKYAGAYEIVNSRKFNTGSSSVGDDREKLRGSGWVERALDGGIDRIYFGVRSLGNIETESQPYYQLTEGDVPADFAKTGSIDEAIQVSGSTYNTPSDSAAGNFSKLTFLSNKVRTYGFSYDEKTLTDSGITEMSGYSAGFALGESPHLTTDTQLYPLANVYGTGAIPPWTGMGLVKLASPQWESGFNEASGSFTWVVNNTGSGTLDECVAYLDALAQTDDDIDTGSLTVTRGKRVRTWYTYDAAGKVVTRSGADNYGLFIENVPTADRQRMKFTDDNGDLKTYPFMIELRLVVGANASADPNGWYHVWMDNNYGTPSAVTLLDSGGSKMSGSTYGQSTVYLEYDWAGGYGSGSELPIVAECEGDGIATQAKTEATITEDAIVTVVVSPGLETNM